MPACCAPLDWPKSCETMAPMSGVWFDENAAERPFARTSFGALCATSLNCGAPCWLLSACVRVSKSPIAASFGETLLLVPGDQVIDHQQHDRADDRRDESCRLTFLVPTDHLPDEGGGDRAGDAEDRGEPEAHRSRTRRNNFCDQARYKSNNDCPDPMHHDRLLRLSAPPISLYSSPLEVSLHQRREGPSSHVT